MKNILYFIVTLSVMAITKGFSQDKKSVEKADVNVDNIVMTWNKSTPEQEMKDDIKALAEHGVTISYSNVKRNDKNEITAIRVEFADKGGSKGSMELDSQKPINTITVYKQGDEVGFGQPSNNDFIVGNFPNGQNFMKRFNFGNGDSDSQSFNFNFPNGSDSFGRSSKIIIENDGKKPLVIEDGKVIEGGDDYSPEEIEKIKEKNKTESFGNGFSWGAQNGNLEDLNEQMERMQEQLNELMNKSDYDKSGDKDDKTIKELNKTKEEMLKAKKEMEETTKELKKAKSSLKTQKA
ncbi:MAG TPA: hypothetical protein PKN96_04155 [Flavobacterium sp.]|uniref:coiled-coil domain-containing protein n=1 Tax=Flavobacterium sp. TaxID=239 RepID=UPI002C50A9C3|nr:hypothetical protein [Flavobacterium sp.]HNP32459.1 hypothetical protein [Flavobacterium sp.]